MVQILHFVEYDFDEVDEKSEVEAEEVDLWSFFYFPFYPYLLCLVQILHFVEYDLNHEATTSPTFNSAQNPNSVGAFCPSVKASDVLWGRPVKKSDVVWGRPVKESNGYLLITYVLD